eukprot:403355017
MVGPGSYNHHMSYSKLTKEPSNAVLKVHNQGNKGEGNLIYVGQNIIIDKEMNRRFPGGFNQAQPGIIKILGLLTKIQRKQSDTKQNKSRSPSPEIQHFRQIERPMSAMPQTRSGIIRPAYDQEDLRVQTLEQNQRGIHLQTQLKTERIIEDENEIKTSKILTEDTPIVEVQSHIKSGSIIKGSFMQHQQYVQPNKTKPRIPGQRNMNHLLQQSSNKFTPTQFTHTGHVNNTPFQSSTDNFMKKSGLQTFSNMNSNFSSSLNQNRPYNIYRTMNKRMDDDYVNQVNNRAAKQQQLHRRLI